MVIDNLVLNLVLRDNFRVNKIVKIAQSIRTRLKTDFFKYHTPCFDFILFYILKIILFNFI